jgi:hypothetical protein
MIKQIWEYLCSGRIAHHHGRVLRGLARWGVAVGGVRALVAVGARETARWACFFTRSKLSTVIDTICTIVVAMKEIKFIVITSHCRYIYKTSLNTKLRLLKITISTLSLN